MIFSPKFQVAVFICLVHFGSLEGSEKKLDILQAMAYTAEKDHLRSVNFLNTQYMIRSKPRIHALEMMMVPLSFIYVCDN